MKGTTIETQIKRICLMSIEMEKFAKIIYEYSDYLIQILRIKEKDNSQYADGLYMRQKFNGYKNNFIEAKEVIQYYANFLRKYASEMKQMEGEPSNLLFSPFVDGSGNRKNGINVSQVDFSAIMPKSLTKDEYAIINVVMYESEYRSVVSDIINESDDPVKEVKSRTMYVEHQSTVRVTMDAIGIEIDNNTEEYKWEGGYINFSFGILVPSSFNKKKILFTVSVYINDIIATRLKFTADVSSGVNALYEYKRSELSISREDVLSAFMSYASQDRNRVAIMIQGMKKARPDMDIFFDVESLRSGDDWENALKREIGKRDVLFLCWSNFARESKWVEWEWKYALENKGISHIEPIPIESPDVCAPPVELQSKHFNDKLLYIINYQNSINRSNKRIRGLQDMV